MRLRSWLIAMCLGLMACGGSRALVQTPTVLRASTSPEYTQQVILDTLPKRQWTTESTEPGRVVASLAVRTHLLRVELRYNAREVAIFYVDSDNLQASVGQDGHVYAHKKVNAWIHRLALDLATALAASAPASLPSGGGVIPTPGAPSGTVDTPPPGPGTEVTAPTPSSGVSAPAGAQ